MIENRMQELWDWERERHRTRGPIIPYCGSDKGLIQRIFKTKDDYYSQEEPPEDFVKYYSNHVHSTEKKLGIKEDE